MPDFDDRLDPVEREIESALRGLTPSAPARGADDVRLALERERIARAFRRRLRTWQAVAAVLAIACAGAAWRLVAAAPAPESRTTIAHDTTPDVAPAPAIDSAPRAEPVRLRRSAADPSYVAMRRAVVERGAVAIALADAGAVEPAPGDPILLPSLVTRGALFGAVR